MGACMCTREIFATPTCRASDASRATMSCRKSTVSGYLRMPANAWRMGFSILFACLGFMVASLPRAAWAISDEIQVYTDEINEPGEHGLELHVNTTPRGRKTPDYEGDLPPYRGVRVTPEFSWGLTKTFEAGLYLPMATGMDGGPYLGGIKGRIKWLPVRAETGPYLGANVELSNVTKKFSESRVGTELRVMAGYRTENWLLGVNPILDWSLSPGHRGSPEVVTAWKASRQVASGLALGAEYYNGLGKLNDRLPGDQQERSLFFVLDVDRKPWVFNLGIGHGLNRASDAWTLKLIFDVPI